MSNAAEIISEVGKVPACTPSEVDALMTRLDLSTKAFAYVMNVTPETVKLWVLGGATPCGTAKRLMQVLSYVPGVIDVLAKKCTELSEKEGC
ncbi:XRE family transcriptional regulator [Ruminococcaceae bacterium OttesenSCG-928-A11]|nr:XRE family transcriptional regulator [Ruminococcaceae bacterium OttesenSCG-928-A11]